MAVGAPVLAALCGCYTGSARVTSWPRVRREPGWVLVPVAFISQQGLEDCGAAALAMASTYLGVPLSRAEIVRERPPRDGGIRAGDLRDLARQHGFQAFLVRGTFLDFERQLGQGRPVIVGLAKPELGGKALLHYEVVVGFNRSRRRILSWDPAAGLRDDTVEGFAREWAPTDRLTLILLAPAASPQPPAPGRQRERIAASCSSRTGFTR